MTGNTLIFNHGNMYLSLLLIFRFCFLKLTFQLDRTLNYWMEINETIWNFFQWMTLKSRSTKITEHEWWPGHKTDSNVGDFFSWNVRIKIKSQSTKKNHNLDSRSIFKQVFLPCQSQFLQKTFYEQLFFVQRWFGQLFCNYSLCL